MRTVVFVDWDQTLVEFRHDLGISALRGFLKKKLPPYEARFLTKWVNETFRETMRASREGKDNIRTRQSKIASKSVLNPPPEGIIYSRELWLLTGAFLHGMPLPRAIAQQAAMAYWNAIADNNEPFPDSEAFLVQLRNVDTTIAIATSSDARLRPSHGTMQYDTRYSRQQKIARIHTSPLSTLCDAIITGDPYDKTSPRFWELARRITKMGRHDRAIMVGDSYATDIVQAYREGIFTILVDRANRDKRENCIAADMVVTTLTDALYAIFDGKGKK